MSDYKIIGTSVGVGILQAKDKVSEGRDGVYTVETTFRALKTSWMSDLPARGTAHPTISAATLVERQATQSSIPWLVDVVLQYTTPPTSSSISGAGTLPPDEYTESANAVEFPIEAHPNFVSFGTVSNGAIFDGTGKFTGWSKYSPYAGYLTYKVPSVTESVTKYSWAQPASVSTLVGGVEGTYWLVVSGSITRRYPYWARTINRIWSSTPWNTTIYPH